VVFLNIADGYMVQELPFKIGLNKFKIEHYTTGQPKMFASDITIIDKKTDRPILAHTVTVNHPLIYDGIAIFQASFGDGGNHLNLDGWNLFDHSGVSFPVTGSIHDTSKLATEDTQYTIEFSDFRPFNIENLGDNKKPMHDARAVMGGNAVEDKKELHNVGPSFQYKLRSADGQAKEYSNYMLPMLLDKRWYLLSGMRDAPNQPFQYIRFPLDPERTLSGFMRLRGAMLDKSRHPEIAQRFVTNAIPDAPAEVKAKLVDSATKVLDIFSQGGYKALSEFIEAKIPAADRDNAAQTYLKILELSTYQAYVLTQAQAHQPAPKMDDETGWFIRDSLNSISDIFFYGAPVYLQLANYDEVQATGLQLTRSPGKNIVFGGSGLLVLGVFSMFYIRERRLWLLIKQNSVLFAMSSNRKTLDFNNEFARHQQDIADIIKGK
jgi:cytochrome c biogenesis protein